MQTQEYLLNALVFFMGSPILKRNALRVIQICMFHQVFLTQKIIKQQQPNGSTKRVVQIYVPEFITKSFVVILPYHAQKIQQPLKEDLLLTEEQKMFITSRQFRQDYFTKDKETLTLIAKEFIQKVADRNEDYNKLMRSFESL